MPAFGGQRERVLPEASWLARPAQLVSSRFSKKPCSSQVESDQHRHCMSTAIPHACTPHTHRHERRKGGEREKEREKKMAKQRKEGLCGQEQ